MSYSIRPHQIDSSRIFRKTIGNLFEKLGYEIVCADTIKQATKDIKNSLFDMILIANELDDGLGMDFAKKCRSQHLVPNETPIFLTTTSSLSNDYIRYALSHGITEILSKNNIKLIYDQLENFAARKLINNSIMKCHVLYIEDELKEAEKTIKILETVGAKVTHFTGTDGVFDFIMHNQISLIISDVLVDGQESVLSLIYRLRSNYTINAIIPVLIITGSDNLSRRIEFFHVGIDDYLVKPFIEQEFLARIKNLLIKRKFMQLENEHSKKSRLINEK